MQTFTTGNTVRATVTFTSDGDPVDPGTVTGTVKDPDGTTTVYTYGSDSELTRSSAGVYRLLIPADIDGLWRVRLHSTGSGKAAIESRFFTKGELD